MNARQIFGAVPLKVSEMTTFVSGAPVRWVDTFMRRRATSGMLRDFVGIHSASVAST